MCAIRSLKTIADLEPGDHACCLYGTDLEHRAAVTALLRQGLERGEKVIYVTDTRPPDSIFGYLRDDGLNDESYLAGGQLSVSTSDDVYLQQVAFDPEAMIAWLRDEVERAVVAGYSTLCLTTEMTWALWGAPGSERLIEYEDKVNEFLAHNPCWVVCQYDQRLFNPGTLLQIVRAHPIVVIGTEAYDNLYYIPPVETMDGDHPGVTLQRWIENLAGRRRAEDALKESESRLRGILSAMVDSVFALDAENRFVFYHTPRSEDLYVPPEHFIGKNHFEVMPPYINELYAKAVVKCRQGEVAEYDYWLEIGGVTRWFSAKLSPVFKEGEFAGIVAVVREITERKQAEEAVRDQNH
jgi:PAS domain S-box-containing protein